ncbi:sugar ABC transporter substrate-binding protein [Actinotalea sp.]|uniref:sugar ABC transporter substrate-binding protein n=1 Tax=Actinotalea sp. TaxID=1872145 RepID=UPI002B76CB11|nr:sugar ABC transporter substrate-binding protein [Actinotalea sp.]HQY33254.1 sugar ABC transporter substrate-binding protein [Actinotalea sp.]HRA51302.1 sugar ABC transporter substrate-binding protein [Actinotalea sp.]
MTVPRSRLTAAALALCAGLALTACTSEAEAPATPSEDETTAEEAAEEPEAQALRIGFIPPTMSVPAFQGLAAGLEGAGSEFGDTVVTAEANFDPVTQIQTIEQWVQLGQIDALWVIPVAADTLTPVIEQAQEAGIVVIAGGLPVDYGMDEAEPGVTFSNVDNTAYGEGIGTLMAECVAERLDGVAEVLFVANAQVQSGAALINEGALAAFAAEAPDATIVQQVDAKEERAADQTLIQTALQANPGANGLFTGDAESTMAAVNAFTNAGADPTTLCIVGNGGTEEQTAAIEAGTLFGVVSFDFMGDMGQNLAELHTLAADPTAPGRVLTTPISLQRG